MLPCMMIAEFWEHNINIYANKGSVVLLGFGHVRLAESWLKLAENTVLAELLWEKNTVPAKKNPNKPNMG